MAFISNVHDGRRGVGRNDLQHIPLDVGTKLKWQSKQNRVTHTGIYQYYRKSPS